MSELTNGEQFLVNALGFSFPSPFLLPSIGFKLSLSRCSQNLLQLPRNSRSLLVLPYSFSVLPQNPRNFSNLPALPYSRPSLRFLLEVSFNLSVAFLVFSRSLASQFFLSRQLLSHSPLAALGCFFFFYITEPPS